jgi:hypothetical protein
MGLTKPGLGLKTGLTLDLNQMHTIFKTRFKTEQKLFLTWVIEILFYF